MNKNLRYTAFVMAALSGCAMSPSEIEDRNKEISSQSLEIKSDVPAFTVVVWTDPDTKRDYVIVSHVKGVAVTPRLPKE